MSPAPLGRCRDAACVRAFCLSPALPAGAEQQVWMQAAGAGGAALGGFRRHGDVFGLPTLRKRSANAPAGSVSFPEVIILVF